MTSTGDNINGDNAFQLFHDECTSDDYERVIAAVKRLDSLALVLGGEQTRAKLLPFLHTFAAAENDEANMVVAQALGGAFVQRAGGAHHLLAVCDALEPLLLEEESLVHSAAAKSYGELITRMSMWQVTERVLPLIERLLNDKWHAAKQAACSLFAPAVFVLRVGDEQSEEAR
jgi:serine/threonine-protein phosphatase 2A regulatory subunit A